MCWGVALPNWICLTKLRTAHFFKVKITTIITKLYQLPLKFLLHLGAPGSPPVQHVPHLTVHPRHSTLEVKNTTSPQSSRDAKQPVMALGERPRRLAIRM